jgi:hypothetical protein
MAAVEKNSNPTITVAIKILLIYPLIPFELCKKATAPNDAAATSFWFVFKLLMHLQTTKFAGIVYRVFVARNLSVCNF